MVQQQRDSFKETLDAPAVRTAYGRVQGFWQSGSSAAYLGIPFAAAPVGRLRFAAPEPPEPWVGVRSAKEFGPTPQRRPFAEVTTIPEPSIPGEDILNLNVYTPAPGDRGARLPVLVWIHGGGYFAGSPASPWYNGRSFNERGIVVVTISYRLGFDGFGWMEGAPLNRGLLDQIAALRWVHDNIQNFGGDPARVTIAGQSAGGGSVLSLCCSPLARGLFRAAIPMSAAIDQLGYDQAVECGRRLADHFHIQPKRDAWMNITHDSILDVERGYNTLADNPPLSSVQDVMQVLRMRRFGGAGLAFRPVVDGEVIPDGIYEQRTISGFAHVPLLIGSTRNEFSFPSQPAPSFDEILHELESEGVSREALEQYAHEIERIGEERAWGQVMTSYIFRTGVTYLVELRRQAGVGSRTWVYDFAAMSSRSRGAYHCHDLPYFFNFLDAPQVDRVLGTALSGPLADAMHSTICTFVRDGQLTFPTAEDESVGAIRFQELARFDPTAYLFDRELLSRSGVIS
ncbi:carboxylesterase/lipase family protein [Alicyclobacillus vulcanalis]|uniref:Carboxylic ester hydrolase n=2 Tax=Alicyclobacillus TaxID=29330 RepID=A0A1N7P3R4_9BACL|nr:carboxylesterase family protein [Alicyclobacillus vulcanalis]SIT05079.1 para-nitrobenzyl esterase [Alicyclobacillus vulcanalis]